MTRDYREIRASAVGFAAVGGYTLFVLASGKVESHDFAMLFGSYLLASMALWAFVGLLGLLGSLIRHEHESPNTAQSTALAICSRVLRERWRRDWMLSLFWPPLLFAMLMASFNTFKQLILIGAPFRFDPLFARIDRLLFLGHDPWRVTHAIFPSPLTTYVLDNAYHAWFAPMSLGVLLCAWLSRDDYRLRTQYLLSYIGVWIGIGSVLAYLLPAAGPCFYDAFVGGPAFQPLLDRLVHEQAAVQRTFPGAKLISLDIQASLLDLYGAKSLAIGGGISAMPSVHNALAALFAFAAFRINRVLGWALAAFAVLIWIGSIDLGWHYAIDGIVSVLLTWGIWHAAGRFADYLERPLGWRRAREAAIA